ncbi:MAG: hypothetical protein JSS82_08285 [Bacteroidetes bacterium]|nr:hypothetical protein [Bacteroidota bacterium]
MPTKISEWDKTIKDELNDANGAAGYLACLHETLPVFEKILENSADLSDLKSELSAFIADRKLFLAHIMSVPTL